MDHCADMHSGTQQLAQQLCGPFYLNNSALGTNVAQAIASATSVAAAVTTGKNVLNLADYPACAVSPRSNSPATV